MGGKKKTKWRKLPIAEFTKECPTTHAQNILTKQDLKTDLLKDQEAQPTNSSYDFVPENSYQLNNEYGECPEGMYLPTTYLVYNPVDVPLYTNFVMPPDPCCYLPQEMAPVQEYATMPYQEYCPPVKDTVYLLIPTPAFRSSHGFPYLTYDWRNRRRRRRYEGYAEYAVIPEKNNYSSNRDKERGKNFPPNLASERNDFQENHTKTMTSFPETRSFPKENQNQGQEFFDKISITSLEMGRDNINQDYSNYEKKERFQDQENSKFRKEKDFCGVHTGKASKINYPTKEGFKNSPRNANLYAHTTKSDSKDINSNKQEDSYFNFESSEGEKKSYKNVTKTTLDSEKKTVTTLDTEVDSNEIDFENYQTNVDKPAMKSLPGSTKKLAENRDGNSVSREDKRAASVREKYEMDRKSKEEKQITSQSLLTNFSNSGKAATLKNNSLQNETLTKNLQELDVAEKRDERSSLSMTKSILSHCSQETEMELRNLPILPALKNNQSIYKLAFDESITDNSEESSRSASPVDPESQVPRSLTNDEILIHEADTGSEAGSEDIELIPHRYESETFLNENKHTYVNKLSLAVELLRTHEKLPYDDQFKRLVGENEKNLKNPKKLTAVVNFGFVNDPSPSVGQSKSVASNVIQNSVVTSQTENNDATNTRIANIVTSEEKFEDSCEEAKEEQVERNINQDASGEVRAGYRRFHVNLRHYFTPRALVNPCLCCSIM